jgi:hypothetical protein
MDLHKKHKLKGNEKTRINEKIQIKSGLIFMHILIQRNYLKV